MEEDKKPRSYEPWDNDRLDRLLEEKGGTIERLGEVDRFRDKLLVKCKVCEHEWEASPATLERSGCPECYKKGRVGARKKAKYTIKEAMEILGKHGYELVRGETYVNNKEPLSIINKNTGEKERVSFRSFLLRINKRK